MSTTIDNTETDNLLKELYFRLRAAEANRTVARDLESDLSRSILETEEQVLAHKHDKSASAVFRKRRARLKRIADGLAWTALGFDEIRLLAYAGNPAPGFMAGKAGYISERLTVEGLYSFPHVAFAIQNDITNILRVGDITVLLPNQTIKVVEVKSGEGMFGLARAERQAERAKRIHDYLHSGKSMALAEGDIQSLQHVEASWSPTYYWERLERVCHEAIKQGAMWKRLDANVLVIAYRPRLLTKLEGIIGAAIASTGWINPRLRFGVLSTHFEEGEKTSGGVRYIIPVTAFRIDPELVTRLLVGDLDVLVILNVTAVVEALRGAGMVVTDDAGQVTIQTESATARISERSWNWVIYGLRTVSTLVRSVQSVLSDPVFAEFCGMTEETESDG